MELSLENIYLMAPKKKKVKSVEEKVGEVDVPLGDENVKMENIADATVGDNFPSVKPVKGKQNEKDNLADEEAGHTEENGFNTRREHHEILSNLLPRDRATEHGGGIGVPEITNHRDEPSDEPTEIPKQPDKEPASPMRLAGILLVVAFLLVILAVLIAPEKPERKPFVLPIIFETKIKELQSSFTNQTDRFWRILKNRGLAHLNNPSPSQPLVLLLAAPPAAHSTVDCFAKKLAEGLDPEYKRMLATIDGREERSYPGEDTKKKMDDLLKRKFMDGHRAALVHHLELLPFPAPLLFHSYCNDHNAPYKHVAIIFTVHLPVEPDASLEPKEAERTVEKYLADEVWAKENKDAVADLLIRVTDTVALMNGEPSSLDTC